MHCCGEIAGAQPLFRGEDQFGQGLAGPRADDARPDETAAAVEDEACHAAAGVLGAGPVEFVVMHGVHVEAVPGSVIGTDTYRGDLGLGEGDPGDRGRFCTPA